MTKAADKKIRDFIVTSQGVSATRWLAFVIGSNPKVFVAHGHFPIDSVTKGTFDQEQSKGDQESLTIGSLTGEFYQQASLDEVFAAYRKHRPQARAYGNVHSYTIDGLRQRFPAAETLAHYAIANVVRHPVTYIESHTRLVRKAEAHPDVYKGYAEDMFPTAVRAAPELAFVDCPDYPEFLAFVVSCESVLHVARDLSHEDVNHVRMESLTSEPKVLKQFCESLTGLDYPLKAIESFIGKGAINRHRSAAAKSDAAAIYRDWPTWKRDVAGIMLDDAVLKRFENVGYDVAMLRALDRHNDAPKRAAPCFADVLKARDVNHPLLKAIFPPTAPSNPSQQSDGIADLIESRHDFNIVKSGGLFYALRKSLGPVDFRIGREALTEKYGADGLPIAETLDGARARADFETLSARLQRIENAYADAALRDSSRPTMALQSSLDERIAEIFAAVDKTSKQIATLRADISNEVSRGQKLSSNEEKLFAGLGHLDGELRRLRSDLNVATSTADDLHRLTAMQVVAAAEQKSRPSRRRAAVRDYSGTSANEKVNALELAIVRASNLFNAAWYLQTYKDVAAANVDPLLHYLAHGAAEGREPHPIFNSAFYKRSYPQMTELNMTPLAHYVWLGVAAGHDPHPLFDTDWYLRENPDVAAMHVNPLLHYTDRGAWQGRDPHPLFDSSWYIERNPDIIGRRQNPLVHYLTVGFHHGCEPNPTFNSEHYRAQNPDVAASGRNPLVHYVLHRP